MARLVRELFGVPKPKGKDDLAPEADDPPWPDVKVVVIVNKRSGSRLVRPLDMPAPNASSSARARSLSGDPPSPPPAHPPSSAPACQGKRLARKLVEVRSRTPVRFPPRASPFARPSPRPSPDGARVYPDGAKSPVVENISTSRLAARLVPTRRVRPHTPPLPSADTPRRTAASFTSTNTFAAATRSRRSWCPWSPRTDPATTFASSPPAATAPSRGSPSSSTTRARSSARGTFRPSPFSASARVTNSRASPAGAPPTTDAASFPLCATWRRGK